MKLKHTLLIAFLFYFISADAQVTSRDMSRITIHAVLPEYKNIPSEPHDILAEKLSQIITENGIEDNEYMVRFVLTAKVNVISKDIVVGPPQRISQKLNITLILGDILEDKVFSRKTISVVGVGNSEEKSFIAAIKNFKPNNNEILQFIQDGKQKILDFYQTHCEDIVVEAQNMASQSQFEQAILLLSQVPDISSNCFSDCMRLTETIYFQMITSYGEKMLRMAQNEWAKNPTRQGAHQATYYLQQINHAAPCQPEVSKLLDQIGQKMNEIDSREWEHEMQVYNDGVEREKREWEHKMQVYNDGVEREKREWEQKKQVYKDSVAREERHWEQQVREHNDRVATQRMLINAVRDVAIEQVRHQPKEINYYRVNYTRIYSW